MTTDYEKSSDKTHATALTSAEWEALSSRNKGLYVVVQTVRADPAARWVSKPFSFDSAVRTFNSVISCDADVYGPRSAVSMRVMSVSEWTRVGAR